MFGGFFNDLFQFLGQTAKLATGGQNLFVTLQILKSDPACGVTIGQKGGSFNFFDHRHQRQVQIGTIRDFQRLPLSATFNPWMIQRRLDSRLLPLA